MEDDWCTLDDDDETSLVIVKRRRRVVSAGTPQETRRVVFKRVPLRARPTQARPFLAAAAPGGRAPAAAVAAPGSGAAAGPRRVRIGSDCTGLNTINIALGLIGFDVVDEFASEKSPWMRSLLRDNFNVGILFNDIFCRDDAHLPDVDLYTAGPPCQPFSVAGLNYGVSDIRGIVFVRVLQVIDKKRPAAFLIENRVGMKTHHSAFYKFVIKFLQTLKDPGGSKTYKVRTRVMDTKVSGGLPQSRPRMYIVGWKRKKEVADFRWPEALKCASLRSLVNIGETGDTSALSEASQANLTLALQSWATTPMKADEVCCAQFVFKI
eukprot:NODE_142_length_1966_cov_2.389325.p1 GENE.NODE_142_length_1966_cov_2.389325~~NODE_142_length_1966_cov_2.389325.p1  ORF type:complete len:322 (-),score=44.43 NODE_142_length_1966_cov_2.389325:846-1811(-)